MALVTINGLGFIPDYPAAHSGNAPAFGAILVDADDEGYGMVFHAPATANITGMGACTGTVTTGDAGMEWLLSTVTVTATPAIPSGTDIGGGSPTLVAVNPSVSNTWYDAVFTNAYSATKGELLAAIIRRPTTGAFNGNFRAFAQVDRGTIGGPLFAYGVANASAGWVASGVNTPCIAINYGGTYYMIRGAWPMSAITTTVLNTGTTPDVAGAQWIPRFKCRVAGVWIEVSTAGAYVVKFYDTDGVTVLASATTTTHERAAALVGAVFLPFDAAVTPTVGSTYWIGMEPSSATSASIYDYTVNSAAIMAATPLGADFCFSSAKDPSGTGSWTPVTTRKPLMGIAYDQLDDGASAGGGVIAKSLIAGGGV